MAEAQKQVAQQLKRFEQTKDVEELRKAADLVEGVEVFGIDDFEKRRAARRDKLRLWTAVLNQLDQAMDPRFDPADVPAMSIAPPTLPDQDTFSGMRPADIKNAAARRQYEEAIEKNREKAERYSLQHKLRKLDERLTQQVEAYVRRVYLKSPESAREVEEVVSKNLKNPQRAARLKELVTR